MVADVIVQPEPLETAAQEPSWVNIASHLPAMAAKQPDTLAVAFPLKRGADGKMVYKQWTYAELEHESNLLARGLQKIGVERGMHTVLMVKPSPEFFALVFAIFKIGAVLVGVDPGMGVRNLKTCLDEAEPQAFIGIRKAHIARKILGWVRRTNRINVHVGRKLLPFGGALALSRVAELGKQTDEPVLSHTEPDATAAILFTSGSTGIPKGVVYTHANFEAQVRALIEWFNIEPGEIDLCTFPLFALFAPAMGMSAIVPDMDFTKPGSVHPPNIIEPIEQFQVTNLFGSPALLKRLATYADEPANAGASFSFPSLKRVNSAGAPVPARVIARIQDMLAPGVQVFTPYGATESLPVACLGSDVILGETAALTEQGHGVCVGAPVNNLDTRIIRISDEVIKTWSDDLELPGGSIGEICVRGPQVTREYFNRESSTRLAKIPCDDGFYHRMGDLGCFDEQGRIWFCGRKAHRVVTADRTYFSVACEGVFNAIDVSMRAALVGVRLNGKVVPAICVEHQRTRGGKSIQEHWKQVEESFLERAEQFEQTSGIKTFIPYTPGAFPVDIRHNSKINREQLAKWAAKQLGGESA